MQGASVLAIHGGAGGTTRSSLSAAQRAGTCASLVRALEEGRAILARGGSALDAVIAAVRVLEDDAAFNAGRGAVLREDGSVALDAAVMSGIDRSAGAVANVRRVRNPVLAAERVRRLGRHVLLTGAGADAFAASEQLEMVEPEYFIVEGRAQQLASARSSGELRLDDHGAFSGGTVGAVARDAQGHLAAATSTGGMTNAAACRIGDSPIIGAGTWAEDATCAVSATGAGESFVRAAFAHEVASGMRLGGYDLEQACAHALATVLDLGGRGGCAAVGHDGRIALPFNTAAMPRGWVRADGPACVALFADEEPQPFES